MDAERLGSWLGLGFCAQEMCGGMHCFERVLYHSSELLFLNAFDVARQPAHEKIGVVDSQWIVHQVVPSLGNQVRRNIMFSSLLSLI